MDGTQHELTLAITVSVTSGVKLYQALPAMGETAWLGAGSRASVVAEVRSTGSTNGRASITFALAKASFAGGGISWMLSCSCAEPPKVVPACPSKVTQGCVVTLKE